MRFAQKGGAWVPGTARVKTSSVGVPGAVRHATKLASCSCKVVTNSLPVESEKTVQQQQKRRKGKSPKGVDPGKCSLKLNGGVKEVERGLKMTAGHSLFSGPSEGTGQALALEPGKLFQNSSEERFVYLQRV